MDKFRRYRWSKSGELVFSRLKTVCLSKISEVQSGGLARNGSVQQVLRVVEEINRYFSQCFFFGLKHQG